MGDVALAVHITSGAAGLILGPIAMLAPKLPGRHTRVGEGYHWVVLTVAASAIVLSVLDFDEIWWFTPIALFSYGFAFLGYTMAKQRPPGWLPLHVIGQSGSYIALVTALLIVNLGKDNLILWFLPTIIGTPLIFWVLHEVGRGRRPRAG